MFTIYKPSEHEKSGLNPSSFPSSDQGSFKNSRPESERHFVRVDSLLYSAATNAGSGFTVKYHRP
jgi:hypothetical protein